MEKLVEAGLIEGVLDVTTTEVADEVVGGILPCGPLRFEAILEAKVPQYILGRAPSVDGFYGASSMERLPTELAIAQRVRSFMGLKLCVTKS